MSANRHEGPREAFCWVIELSFRSRSGEWGPYRPCGQFWRFNGEDLTDRLPVKPGLWLRTFEKRDEARAVLRKQRAWQRAHPRIDDWYERQRFRVARLRVTWEVFGRG